MGKRFFAIGIAVVTIAGLAFGNGYRILSIKDTRANAMGEAVAAQSGSPSAIAYNPAGLAGLEGTQAGVHLTTADVYADHKSPAGITSHNETEWQYIPSLFLATDALKNDLVAGIGITMPNGFFSEWKTDSFARYVATYSELRVIDTAPSIAGKIGKSLMVGAGLNFLYSEVKLKRMVDAGAAAGAPGMMDMETRLKGDGTGLGYNVGLIYAINKNQRVALSYRSAVTVDYHGSMAGLGPELDADTQMDFPPVVVAGYMVKPSDKLTVELDLDWTAWKEVDDITVKFDAPMIPDSVLVQDFNDTIAWKLGMEYQQTDTLALRGGYVYSPRASSEAAWRPNLLDLNVHLLSVGVGYVMDALTLDMAFVYAIYSEKGINNNVDNNELSSSSSVDGKYSAYSPALSLGMTYRF